MGICGKCLPHAELCLLIYAAGCAVQCLCTFNGVHLPSQQPLLQADGTLCKHATCPLQGSCSLALLRSLWQAAPQSASAGFPAMTTALAMSMHSRVRHSPSERARVSLPFITSHVHGSQYAAQHLGL